MSVVAGAGIRWINLVVTSNLAELSPSERVAFGGVKGWGFENGLFGENRRKWFSGLNRGIRPWFGSKSGEQGCCYFLAACLGNCREQSGEEGISVWELGRLSECHCKDRERD